MRLEPWQQVAFAILAAAAIVLLCGSAFLLFAFTDNPAPAPRATFRPPTASQTPGVQVGSNLSVFPSPTASVGSRATATATATAPRTRIPPTATPRPTAAPPAALAGFTAIGQYSGEFFDDTPPLALPAGTIHVVVIYADDGEWVSVSETDQYQHAVALRNIEAAYQPSLSTLQAQLNMALAVHDAAKADALRKQLDALSAKKTTDVDAENARYDALLAALQAKRPAANIRVYLDRPNAPADTLLLTFLGSGTRAVDFASTGASDYFFHVESTGGWTLNVYHKK